MKFDAFVAKRYLSARRKQAFIFVISWITLIGITVGVAALNVALSVHNGMRSAFIKSLVGGTGSLQLMAGSFRGEGFDARDIEEISAVIAQLPDVTAFAVLTQEPGVIISNRKRLQYVNLYGILPEQYTAASDHLNRLTSGDLAGLAPADAPPFGMVLGHDLAARLGVVEGDTVQVAVPRISSPGLTRSGFKFREMRCSVVGRFKTGNSQFDERDAYIHLKNLLLLLNTTSVKQVLVTFKDIEAMDRGKHLLIGHPGLPLSTAVVDFRDLNGDLLHALELEKMATTLVISIFILVVALNMISALIMLVMEKHRDIGIMKAFGTPARTIQRIFIRQGMTLSWRGTLAGTVLGVGVAVICDKTRLFSLDNNVYEVLSYLPFEVHAWEVAAVAAGSLAVSFLTSVFPARQAARLDPVEALKYD